MNLLQQILRDKKDDVERAKTSRPLRDLQKRICDIPKPLGFRQALTRSGFGMIAEIKKKSPSMGAMSAANVEEAQQAYKESELVKAVSILTDWKYFGMMIEDLERLKTQIGKPALRKDFIFDEYQVFEARAFGADAILLMACVLESKRRLRALFEVATELGMDVLFECHSSQEIEMIPDNAQIYGINSRKFKESHRSFRYRASRLLGKLSLFGLRGVGDLSTDTDLFKELIKDLPRGVVKVAESGVTPKTISEVRSLGFDSVLIGTALLQSPNGVARTLESFRTELQGACAPEGGGQMEGTPAASS